MEWRLVDSDLSEPEYTVAADEAIARARSKGLVPNTLHFYRRKVPTVSMGYFQKADEALDIDFCRRNCIRILRRASGGSAIYTDPGHLIYGLVVDEAEIPADRNEAFRKVCSAITLALGSLGIQAEFKPANDVLVNRRKISGSAQMRRWGTVLQHGTLVLYNDIGMMTGALKMDTEKVHSRNLEPETYVTSLEETLGHAPDIQAVKSALVDGFEKTFGVTFRKTGLTEFENELIRELTESKYGRDEWNLSR